MVGLKCVGVQGGRVGDTTRRVGGRRKGEWGYKSATYTDSPERVLILLSASNQRWLARGPDEGA
jgi:hypothetical protein